MKKQTRPFEPALDELQRLLDVPNPDDLPDAVRALQARNALLERGLKRTVQLIDKLEKQIEVEGSRGS